MSRRVTAWLAVLLLAAGVAVGYALLSTDTPNDDAAGLVEGVGQDWREAVACSIIIADGTIRQIKPLGGRVGLRFEVDQWLKPTSGKTVLDVVVPDPAADGAEKPYRLGGPTLLVVPERKDQIADALRDERRDLAKTQFKRAIATAETEGEVPCPEPFKAG